MIESKVICGNRLECENLINEYGVFGYVPDPVGMVTYVSSSRTDSTTQNGITNVQTTKVYSTCLSFVLNRDTSIKNYDELKRLCDEYFAIKQKIYSNEREIGQIKLTKFKKKAKHVFITILGALLAILFVGILILDKHGKKYKKFVAESDEKIRALNEDNNSLKTNSEKLVETAKQFSK